MTPATKTRRKKGDPREIERSDKAKVPVQVRGDRITAQWDCQTRSFTVDDLRQFIEHVDLSIKVEEPMSLHWEDTDGLRFWCRVKDGKFYAAESQIPDGRLDTSARSVSWAQLKRAFQATITEMAS